MSGSSPTQIAIFVASTSVAGGEAGLFLLLSWVGGLVVANSMLALIAGFGLLRAEYNFGIYSVVAVLVSIGSIAMGTIYLTGFGALPEIDR